MPYVKGCTIDLLTKYTMKKFEQGKYMIEEGFQSSVSLNDLKELLAIIKTDFVNANGKTEKGKESGQVLLMFKKIDKQKKLLGYAYFKRLPGEPSDKTGMQAWFEGTKESYVCEKRMFATGFEKEEEYFDESVIRHLKDVIGFGQVKEAEYFDKMLVIDNSKNNLKGLFGSVGMFVINMILWSLVFHNIGLGICFAFCMTSACVTVVSKKDVKEAESLN